MQAEAQHSRGRWVTLGVTGVAVLALAGSVLGAAWSRRERVAGLQSGDPGRRRAAVRALMREAGAGGSVAEQLQGERAPVRAAGIDALALLRDDPDPEVRRAAARFLTPFFKDPDKSLRARALRALVAMGPGSALGAAIEALDDPEKPVMEGAQRACEALAPASILALLEYTGPDGKTACLRTKRRVYAGNALAAIAKRGDARWTSLVLFGTEPVPGVVDYLDAARATEDDQNNAISILDRIGDRRAVPYLLAALETPATRRAAVGALGRLADPRATPALVRLLPRDEADRLEIVVALGRIGDSPAVEPLVRSGLGCESRPVRLAAAESLGRIGRPALPALLAASRDPATEPLAVYRAEGAALALGEMRLPEATAAAVACLRHPEARVRRAGAEALAGCGDPAVVSSLVEAFADPDGQVGGRAARSAATFGVRAVPALMTALGDPERSHWAATALRAVGPPANPALERAVLAGGPAASAAALLLGEVGDARAVPTLRRALAARADADFRFAAERSLRRLDTREGA